MPLRGINYERRGLQNQQGVFSMSQSETIGKLADALAKEQRIMEGARKDSQTPFFKSSYADLASVWDACRKPLANNGLSVVQTADFLPQHPEVVCIDPTL